VPLLGDIPILGWLFRREERTRSNSEVVFVLTPRVLPRASEQR
jgi:type IV pilus assembly protein PilQ